MKYNRTSLFTGWNYWFRFLSVNPRDIVSKVTFRNFPFKNFYQANIIVVMITGVYIIFAT